MNFNSLPFVAFFIVVYAAYLLFQKSFRIQNAILLIASMFFYGCWSVPFLGLLLATVIFDFFWALAIDRSKTAFARKLFLAISVGSNLGVLGIFKYFNIGVAAFESLFHINRPIAQIILPLGISFYTFHSMSYTIDVYRRTIRPTRNLVNFILYVLFFPQLVAGPIARAHLLLLQFSVARKIKAEQINAGLWLILWGYFEKVVIADHLARLANPVFDHVVNYRGLDLWIAALAFTFQILCDFSGYSNIARGLSKCMGFELTLNFNLPYFAKNPKEFWNRWHISLSSWFRDYVYIPLGGNRVPVKRHMINLFLTMFLAGLWHGGSWNFILWGCYHASALVLYHL